LAVGERNIACVLDDGSRYFLKRRKCPALCGAQNNRFLQGHLLPKSMSELMKEADNMQILLRAKRSVAEQEKLAVAEQLNVNSSIGMISHNLKGSVSINDMGLWVDKYTPKAFSQVIYDH
jgi:hypothetical protein